MKDLAASSGEIAKCNTQDKACNISVMPQNMKDTVLTDSNSNGSDMEYGGDDRPFVECICQSYANSS